MRIDDFPPTESILIEDNSQDLNADGQGVNNDDDDNNDDNDDNNDKDATTSREQVEHDNAEADDSPTKDESLIEAEGASSISVNDGQEQVSETVESLPIKAIEDNNLPPTEHEGTSPRGDDNCETVAINDLDTSKSVDVSNDLQPPIDNPHEELNNDKNTASETSSEGKESTPEDNPEAFVNQGLLMWQQHRQQWLGHQQNRNMGSSGGSESSSVRAVATPLDVDEIIDVIFAAPRYNGRDTGPRKFPQAVPLPQMVDILQDLWEAEGLDI